MIPNTKVLLNPQERGVTIFVAQMFYLSQFSGGIQTFDLWMMTTVFNYCPTTVIPKCNLGNQFDLQLGYKLCILLQMVLLKPQE